MEVGKRIAGKIDCLEQISVILTEKERIALYESLSRISDSPDTLAQKYE